ncbi:MAG: ABC transporter ATP-binding protein [Coprococcus sp.]|nr:ABC transporter ATP-binding protein [Coprococcus sp.]
MFIIKNISKSYGSKSILSDISFEVKSGICIGLLGINGSGKSTLLNILAGCIKPDSGNYYFDGEGKLSYLPQENPLMDDLTALDNMKLWYKGSSRNMMSDKNKLIFSQLGVESFLKKKVKTLSGGMKKRLSLAIALMNEPDILLLDEPLSALDMLCKQGIIICLQGFLADGGSIIIATHETAALDICHKIYSLKGGTLHLVYDIKNGDKKLTEEEFCRILLS